MQPLRCSSWVAGVIGLFRGLVPTLVREVLGNAAMFGVYDLIKDRMAAARVRRGGEENGADSMWGFRGL